MSWYLQVLKKYAVFSGRARRKEYWYFFLFNLIISIVLGWIGNLLWTYNVLSGLYSLAVLLPSLGVSVSQTIQSTGPRILKVKRGLRST